MCVNSALIDLQSLSLTADAQASISHSLDNPRNAAANVVCDELGYIWGQRVRYICEFSCKFFVFFTILCDYLRCELNKVKCAEFVTVTYLCQIETSD